MPTLVIDGRTVEAAEGTFLLAAARKAGIRIPTLCAHEAVEPYGGCRLCVVDITRKEWDGWYKMVVACLYPVEDGLIVRTDTERVRETRAIVLDLLLARCPDTPLVKTLAAEYGIEKTTFLQAAEPTDCILCGLCTRICDKMGTSAIASANRGVAREIAPPFREAPPDCTGCLACAEICPTHFIRYEADATSRTIWGKRFEMLRCSECGQAYITAALADFQCSRNGVPRSYFDTCDACKRRKLAAVAESFQGVGR